MDRVLAFGGWIAFLVFIVWLFISGNNPFDDMAQQEMDQIAQEYATIDSILERAVGVEDCNAALIEYFRVSTPPLLDLKLEIEGLSDPAEEPLIPEEFREFMSLSFGAGVLVIGCTERLRRNGHITDQEQYNYLKYIANFP